MKWIHIVKTTHRTPRHYHVFTWRGQCKPSFCSRPDLSGIELIPDTWAQSMCMCVWEIANVCVCVWKPGCDLTVAPTVARWLRDSLEFVPTQTEKGKKENSVVVVHKWSTLSRLLAHWLFLHAILLHFGVDSLIFSAVLRWVAVGKAVDNWSRKHGECERDKWGKVVWGLT